jgi:phenylacetate-CoA ligase
MSALDMWHLVAAARRRRNEQWYSADRLSDIRAARLRHLARLAYQAPFYRDIFDRARIAPDTLNESSLDRLPVLEKADLRTAGDQTLPDPTAPRFAVNTSGSTGIPLQLARNQRDQAEISALWARVFSVYGRQTRDRQVNIGSGRAVAKKGPVVKLRELGILPQLHQLASFDPPERQIALLRAVKPHMLSAYAVGLELLAEAVIEAGVQDIRPRIVYTSGTALTPRCRTLSKRAFGVEPYDVYAANEVGPIAWECPVHRGALHLNDDAQILELVDEAGRRVPPGSSGEVVVTQLLCTTQPLIRYRIGDVTSLVVDPCKCGRALRLMHPVEGRTRHIIRSPEGMVINNITVSSILSSADEVRRYQVRQTGPRQLRILVIPSPSWNGESSAAVCARFVERLGDAFQYEIVCVDDLPIAPSGKFQTIVPLEEPVQPLT